MVNKTLISFLFASSIALCVSAQESTPEPNTEPDESNEIEAIKAELSRLQQELETRDAKANERIDELEAELEARELAELEELTEEVDVDKYFKIYGFLDLTFFRFFMDEDSPFQTLLHDDVSTFMMSNINLYFDSQMTDTLNALIELRFTFSPIGDVLSYEVANAPGTEFERRNTMVRDPFTSYADRIGGIVIERAHLTYSPFEGFNVMAGRFLTPYGIWNVDHTSTVVLPTHMPYLQSMENMPSAQTGLQIFGRFFPIQRVYFDYAVTLSNGRGPREEFIDLDENKAVGLKLKLTYETRDVTIACGGYGYIGDYTDTKPVLHFIHLDPEITPEEPAKVEVETLEKHREYIVSADLLIQLFGLKLQAEYVWRRANMEQSPPLFLPALVTTGGVAGAPVFLPSFIGRAAYGLLSYRLPLDRFLGEMSITPYVLFEYMSYMDTVKYLRQRFYIGGLNFAPSRYVTLKVEGAWVEPLHDTFGRGISYAAAQLAVSF